MASSALVPMVSLYSELEEKVRVMEIFVEEAKGRVPVYAGTGCVSTAETIALSKRHRRSVWMCCP